MNKKGQVFVIIVVVFTALALYTMVAGMNQKYNSKIKSQIDATVGRYASLTINAYQEQEAGMLYLDNAAKLSLSRALIEAGNNGGLEDNECGNSAYNLWNSETESCLPEQEKEFKKIFSRVLGEELTGFNKFPISNKHFLTMSQKGEELEVIGETNEKIRIALTLDGDVKEAGDIETREIPPEAIARINQYDSIIQQASHEHQVEEALIKAIITQESLGDAKAVSPTGAAGIMQFTSRTAKDYFESEVEPITPVCQLNHCEPDNTRVYIEDPRFDPVKAIPAGAKYLSVLRNNKEFRELSQAPIFAVASYNAGSGPIILALLKTKKDDPVWEEVTAVISPDTLKQFDPYKSWSDEQVNNKIDEIKTYVERVRGYFVAWGGLDLRSPTTTGFFEFGQNFKTSTEYNLSIYEELKEFAQETIDECKDNVSKCLDNKMSEYNKEHDTELLHLHDCEEGAERVFYDFIENLQDCTYSWGDNCKCKITEEYSEDEIKAGLKEDYRITFSEKIVPQSMVATPKLFFEVEMAEPKELKAEFSIEDTNFWAPEEYLFEYNKELENKRITFYDQLSGNRHELEDFNKLFLVKRNNKLSLWVDSEFSEKFRTAVQTPSEIPNECTVAKQTFRICAKTTDKLPVVKENNNRKELVYEEAKIKFALTLIDETPPAKVKNLNVQRSDSRITITWEQENIDDLVLYKASYYNTATNEQLIGEFYKEQAEENIAIKEKNKLYYEGLPNTEIKYYLEIEKSEFNIQDDTGYTFKIAAIDNFQNKNTGTEFLLIAES
ncbi:lytic transglycosylase domain-containing protein [Candidatus Woesearchaeota archaeon]|nr:lytic transglycosylase domain-containing protein [Candidatus Woesearchaeota archaeon]